MTAVRRFSVIAALVLTSSFLVTETASAAPPGEDQPTARTVSSQRATSADLARAERATPATARDAAIGRHVSEQARSGRLLDRKNVHAAAALGGEVTWESGSVVEEIRVDKGFVTGKKGRAETMDLGLVTAERTDPGVQTAGVTGAGMGKATVLGGLSAYWSDCAEWTVSGNKITSCWEKMKPERDYSTTRDYYAYNRYGTALGKINDNNTDWYVSDFSMRSRPRVGYEYRTDGMNGYFPISSSELCNELGSTSLSVGNLSFSIPVRDCDERYPDINIGDISMGVVFDGGYYISERVQGIDYEQEVYTGHGDASPMLGYYNYGRFCWTPFLSQNSYCSTTAGNDGWY